MMQVPLQIPNEYFCTSRHTSTLGQGLSADPAATIASPARSAQSGLEAVGTGTSRLGRENRRAQAGVGLAAPAGRWLA